MPRFDRLEMESSAHGPAATAPAAALESRDGPFWLRQADAERRQALYENALRHYSRALENDKSLIAGWVGQVQMLVCLGEFPEADLWARKALELFKNQPDLLAGRAQALCRRGNRSEARAICDNAMAQPGESAYRWTVRGEIMVSGRQDTDRFCFDKACQADADWLAPFEIAAVLLYYRRPGKGLIYARRAADLSPESASVWFRRAECEAELELNDAACRSLRRCLELSSRHIDADLMLHRIEHQHWSPIRLFRRLFRRS
jgi:tetratricopeptide (TPR) repeat protein